MELELPIEIENCMMDLWNKVDKSCWDNDYNLFKERVMQLWEVGEIDISKIVNLEREVRNAKNNIW